MLITVGVFAFRFGTHWERLAVRQREKNSPVIACRRWEGGVGVGLCGSGIRVCHKARTEKHLVRAPLETQINPSCSQQFQGEVWVGEKVLWSKMGILASSVYFVVLSSFTGSPILQKYFHKCSLPELPLFWFSWQPLRIRGTDHLPRAGAQGTDGTERKAPATPLPWTHTRCHQKRRTGLVKLLSSLPAAAGKLFHRVTLREVKIRNSLQNRFLNDCWGHCSLW